MTFILSILTLIFAVLPITPKYLPIDDGQTIIHQYYILSYNEEAEQANWVYYKITKEMLAGDAERNSNFRYDPLVTTQSASTNDYTKSGYDRGHLCPAADMKFDNEAMYESFYMSNVSPQVPGFNRGIWKKLESQVRNWTREKDSLYVVSGPILNDTDVKIGDNEVNVPAYFYKVLYEPAHNKMIAFIIPNEPSAGTLNEFASTVDSLEQITGIDFFSQLPDKLENRLESEIVSGGWFGSPISTSIPTKRERKPLLMILLAISGIIILLLLLLRTKK